MHRGFANLPELALVAHFTFALFSGGTLAHASRADQRSDRALERRTSPHGARDERRWIEGSLDAMADVARGA
jgi:hypothetical protein